MENKCEPSNDLEEQSKHKQKTNKQKTCGTHFFMLLQAN